MFNPSGDQLAPTSLSEKAVADVVARFYAAFDARDVDAVVGLFSEHGDWRLGPGTFSGKAAIRRIMEWDVRASPTVSARESGIGTVVRGNVAINERIVEQTFEGIQYSYPAVTVFELSHTGEIEHARSYYDKLLIFRQVANAYPGLKGWFFKTIVNFMAAQGGEEKLARS